MPHVLIGKQGEDAEELRPGHTHTTPCTCSRHSGAKKARHYTGPLGTNRRKFQVDPLISTTYDSSVMLCHVAESVQVWMTCIVVVLRGSFQTDAIEPHLGARSKIAGICR